MGNPDFAIPTLEAIIQSDHELIGVVSNPPKYMGRGRILSHTPVGKFSKDNDLTLLEPQSLESFELKNNLIDLKPDVFEHAEAPSAVNTGVSERSETQNAVSPHIHPRTQAEFNDK